MPATATRHMRLLSSAQLAIMAFLRKEGESYAAEVFRVFELISKEINGGVLLLSESGCNRALWKLEELKLIHSWNHFSEVSRGVPRRMYSLTLAGEETLDQQLRMLRSLGLQEPAQNS